MYYTTNFSFILIFISMVFDSFTIDREKPLIRTYSFVQTNTSL
ncbi:putative membrane protein [Staphylococcus phage Terranova]|nr:putative membrane protein [Staphylococcus phage Quidividi]AXY83948.1 putative membrane protein [Staphylococcus phage Terranova]